MIEAFQARLQCRRIEVHEQAGGTSREFEIRDDLGKMDRMNLVDCFQLDNDAAVHDKIEFQIAA